MNLVGVLERVFERIDKEAVIEMIKQRKPNWSLPKKSVKKQELKEEFVSLQELIQPDEVEDFIEMAVMSRAIGLPAYTYKVTNLNFLSPSEENKEGDQPIKLQDVNNIPFQRKYSITIENIEEDIQSLLLVIRLKEYSEIWRSGEQNIESLSAVYKINVTLDKTKNVVTIFSGNHKVQEVLKDFFSFVLKWPIQNYRIREIPNQLNQIGNASFKTALLLDFIFNRARERGIFSKFKEIKFNTKNKRHTKEGIRNITINGRNLLSSQLACEYITLGSDIISFKVDMTYNEVDFSSLFFLKGTNLDILKIVVTGQEDENFKQEIVDILQEEYINMCTHGIMDIDETKKLLEQIYDKFIHGDKLVNEVIQGSVLKIVDSVSQNLDKFDIQDENILDMLTEFYRENKVILDSVGFDGVSEGLDRIKEHINYEENEEEIFDDIDSKSDSSIDDDFDEDN
jgi:riboflavin synthase